MNAAVTVEDVARDFPTFLREIRVQKQETLITEAGVPVAKITPFAPRKTQEELLRQIQETQDWWMSVTTEDEREAFARDIESAHTMMNQPLTKHFHDGD